MSTMQHHGGLDPLAAEEVRVTTQAQGVRMVEIGRLIGKSVKPVRFWLNPDEEPRVAARLRGVNLDMPLRERAPEIAQLVAELPTGGWGASEIGTITAWLAAYGFQVPQDPDEHHPPRDNTGGVLAQQTIANDDGQHLVSLLISQDYADPNAILVYTRGEGEDGQHFLARVEQESSGFAWDTFMWACAESAFAIDVLDIR